VVVGAELLTVVATAHQSNQATSVAVIDPSVPRAVTVALSLATGILRSAAPPPVIVPTPAPLSGWWIQGGPGHDHWSGGAGQVLREVTAVVFLVEVGSELLTVVAPAHQVTLAAPVSVIHPAVQRTVTVALPQATGLLRSAASLPVVVPPPAPLAFRRIED